MVVGITGLGAFYGLYKVIKHPPTLPDRPNPLTDRPKPLPDRPNPVPDRPNPQSLKLAIK